MELQENSSLIVLILGALAGAIFALALLGARWGYLYRKISLRYGGVRDIDSLVQERRAELTRLQASMADLERDIRRRTASSDAEQQAKNHQVEQQLDTIMAQRRAEVSQIEKRLGSLQEEFQRRALALEAAQHTKHRETQVQLDDRIRAHEADHRKRIRELNAEYQVKRELYERLIVELESVEDSLEMASYGLYSPHYQFDTPQEYKNELDESRRHQKEMTRNGMAAVCPIEWTVDGSKREGKKMTQRTIKLMLKAFNGECDAAVANIRWNNALKMEERIRKAFEALCKLGEPHQTTINPEYLRLKLDELRLAHEYANRRQEQKEEQRQLREQMREEERVQREIEEAVTAAESEEARYGRALEQARREISDKAQSEVLRLQQLLDEARDRKERAISRAQMTRAGYVYVISNIGSFGSNVYKIGLTRRLEPMDRVHELGDASVPFPFDVHAMIFSEDAPALEALLHRELRDKQVNMVNNRKEFFRSSLDNIERIATAHHGTVEFTMVAEARQYRETLALIEQDNNQDRHLKGVAVDFPPTLDNLGSTVAA